MLTFLIFWLSDDELAAIRARRAAQLQGASGSRSALPGAASGPSKADQEERQRAAEDQRAQILKALLAPTARQRRKLFSVVV